MVKTMRDAIREALDEELARDERVFLLGEDIGVLGGAVRVTQGLWKKYGADRVIDTPISESGFTGMAVGAAMMGMRPVVEIMFADFLCLASDHLINEAAKIRYLYNGQKSCPMVLRTQFGAGTRSGPHHCQSSEAWLGNIPGLTIVVPSNAYDAKGLLKAAIRCNDPVLFFEHKFLYGTKCEVPDGDYEIPLGKADIKKEGSDVTIIAYGNQVPKALTAAKIVEKDGINAEVLDLRTVRPLDIETIVESVKKTNRVVISHESPQFMGYGAEVAAIICEHAFGYLDGPIIRACAPETPVPFAPTLEDAYIPSAEKIADAVKKTFA